MSRLKLTLAYEGTRYAGWQLQSPGDRPEPATVQGELERAVASIAGRRIPLHAAGRTDAGVHAEGQVCHLDLPEDGNASLDWKRALNALLPFDIRIMQAERVPLSFHARNSAVGKRYAYSLWMHRDKALPRIRNFVWSTPALDLARMREASAHLLGERDFASFQNTGTPMKSTVRSLFSLDFRQGMVAGLVCPPDWPVVTLVFEGNGFLKQMVRNLTGLLVWTGLGKIAPAAVPGILAARKRAALPSPSAPACGLTLLDVFYS